MKWNQNLLKFDHIFQGVIANRNAFQFNTVYSLYMCGKCIIPNEEDKNRSNRQMNIQDRYGDWSMQIVCNCEQKSRFLSKFKICSVCKTIWFSHHLLDNGLPCKECQEKNDPEGSFPIGKKVTYWQKGKEIKKPKDPIITQPLCVHRSECLEVIVESMRTSDKGKKKVITCNDCPYFRHFSGI